MVHSDACTKLVAFFEGFRSHVYLDQGGIPTIGYGHTQGISETTPPCTEAQALIWLDIDLHAADEDLASLVKVPLLQNQYDALASLVYNIGYGDLSISALLKLVNAKADPKVIAPHFLAFVNVKGKRDQGLVNRRTREMHLFLGESA